MVVCLGRGADMHMAQPMPMPFTVSCFSKIQIGATSTFLVPAHKGPLNGFSVVVVYDSTAQSVHQFIFITEEFIC